MTEESERNVSKLIGIVSQQQGSLAELRAEFTRALEQHLLDAQQTVKIEHESSRTELFDKLEKLETNRVSAIEGVQTDISKRLDQQSAKMVELEKACAEDRLARENGLTSVRTELNNKVAEVRRLAQDDRMSHLKTAADLRTDVDAAMEQIKAAQSIAQTVQEKEEKLAPLRADIEKALPQLKTLPESYASHGQVRELIERCDSIECISRDFASKNYVQQIMQRLDKIEGFTLKETQREAQSQLEALAKLINFESVKYATLRGEFDKSVQRLDRIEEVSKTGFSEVDSVQIVGVRGDLNKCLERLNHFEVVVRAEMQRNLDVFSERLNGVEAVSGPGLRNAVDRALERLNRVDPLLSKTDRVSERLDRVEPMLSKVDRGLERLDRLEPLITRRVSTSLGGNEDQTRQGPSDSKDLSSSKTQSTSLAREQTSTRPPSSPKTVYTSPRRTSPRVGERGRLFGEEATADQKKGVATALLQDLRAGESKRIASPRSPKALLQSRRPSAGELQPEEANVIARSLVMRAVEVSESHLPQ
jgi:hypothetical protein